MRLLIKDIKVDSALSPRTGINRALVNEYKDILSDILSKNPIVVWKDEGKYHLIDGFHRINAAAQAGWEEIECSVEVTRGMKLAFIRAVELNTQHGAALTRDERTNAVRKILLIDPSLSIRAISQISGVCQATISNIRKDMDAKKQIKPPKELTGKDGRSYTDRRGTGNPGSITSRKYSYTVYFASQKQLEEVLRAVKLIQKMAGTESVGAAFTFMAAEIFATYREQGHDAEEEKGLEEIL